tara:strand:+ start:89 stop:1156 length:1068 start_codon:yes stop_codon:yes gene_type:complete
MARQFLIGELGGATSTSTGLLADTALDIQVLSTASETGPVSYAYGDPIPDMFRIVQGTGTGSPNVYSNWINPRNVIVYDGTPAEVAVHHEADIDIATTAALASGGSATNMTLELKFVNKSSNEANEFWNLSVDIAVGDTNTAQQDKIAVAYDNATKPDWLVNTCATDAAAGGSLGQLTGSRPAGSTALTAPPTDRVTFYGNVPGSTLTSSGNTYEGDAAKIQLILTSQNDIGDTVYTIVNDVVNGQNGAGTYYTAKKFEEKIRGNMYGYYNRIQLPNTPDVAAVDSAAGALYDFVTIVATKDGSSASGQIHGVDNLDEIFIGGLAGVATWSETANTSFIAKLDAIINLPGLYGSI